MIERKKIKDGGIYPKKVVISTGGGKAYFSASQFHLPKPLISSTSSYIGSNLAFMAYTPIVSESKQSLSKKQTLETTGNKISTQKIKLEIT